MKKLFLIAAISAFTFGMACDGKKGCCSKGGKDKKECTTEDKKACASKSQKDKKSCDSKDRKEKKAKKAA